jgi:methylthioribose-1-phosphate isomerase
LIEVQGKTDWDDQQRDFKEREDKNKRTIYLRKTVVLTNKYDITIGKIIDQIICEKKILSRILQQIEEREFKLNEDSIGEDVRFIMLHFLVIY